MTTETETAVADTAGLTFTANFLTLSTYGFGPEVAVHLSDQSGHPWGTEWSRSELSELSGLTYCLSYKCEQPGHRKADRRGAHRLDIPAARKVALAYVAEQGLTRFLPGAQS